MSMTLAAPHAGLGNTEPMMELNMTPLIDVMLVLIIMLIVTIPKPNHALNLDMPLSQGAKTEKVADTIDVDFDGTIQWNGSVVAGRPELEAKLANAALDPAKAEIHIRANGLAAYDVVAGVLASTQRHGIHNVAMVGNEQFVSR
jgi:biopolymer transport protein ExbD